jgi:DNA-binding transcriptional ArsR family regulator
MGVPKTGRFSGRGEQLLDQMRRVAILMKYASDATRFRMISVLTEGEKHVTAICHELNVGQPLLNHHLTLLRQSGIIAPRREGNNIYCSLAENGEVAAQAIKKLIASVS